MDLQGKKVANIAKKWGGALREVFTNADAFLIDYGAANWKAHERAVIFAAAISIDFDFFEQNKGGAGANLLNIGS